MVELISLSSSRGFWGAKPSVVFLLLLQRDLEVVNQHVKNVEQECNVLKEEVSELEVSWFPVISSEVSGLDFLHIILVKHN